VSVLLVDATAFTGVCECCGGPAPAWEDGPIDDEGRIGAVTCEACQLATTYEGGDA
jgi:hypothetical protein